MQLDLFLDTRDVILRRGVADALLAREAVAARAALSRLEADFPRDASLRGLARLLAWLERPRSLMADAPARRAVTRLRRLVAPLATQQLGPDRAGSWVRRCWVELAEDCRELPLAAACWLEAGQPARAIALVQALPDWRERPECLAWMVRAHLLQDALAEAWPLLMELAWRHPAGAARLLGRTGARAPSRLAARFAGEFVPGGPQDWAWFPAWLVLSLPTMEDMLLRARPGSGQPGERAARLLAELRQHERQGRHACLVKARQQLHALHPELFRRYMDMR